MSVDKKESRTSHPLGIREEEPDTAALIQQAKEINVLPAYLEKDIEESLKDCWNRMEAALDISSKGIKPISLQQICKEENIKHRKITETNSEEILNKYLLHEFSKDHQKAYIEYFAKYMHQSGLSHAGGFNIRNKTLHNGYSIQPNTRLRLEATKDGITLTEFVSINTIRTLQNPENSLYEAEPGKSVVSFARIHTFSIGENNKVVTKAYETPLQYYPDKHGKTCPEAIFRENNLEDSKSSTSQVTIHLQPKGNKDIPPNISRAISNDDPETLKPLLDEKFIHTQYAPSKETLLHTAIQSNSPKVAVMLMDDYGADPRSYPNKAGYTPIQLADLETSKKNLKDNKSLDDSDKKEKSNPTEEDSDVFNRMLSIWMEQPDFKDKVNKKYGKYEETLLHLAIQAGSTEAAKKLIDSEADVNAFSRSTNNGKETDDALPIHFAFGHKPPLWEIIDLLREKMADLNQKTFAGATPLHKLVATCSSLKTDVQAFTDKIKKSSDSTLEQSVLEAHKQLFISQEGTAEAISKLRKVSESLQDNEPLKTELAILIKNLEVTSEGLNTKLKPFLENANINTPDNYGTTPLANAAQKGIFQLVDIFINHEAEITPKEIKEPKNKVTHTKTTLHWAMQSKTTIPEHLLDAFIEKNDTNIHQQDPKTKESAFSEAIKKGDVELVRKLYTKTSEENQAAVIDSRYRTGQETLLHLAVESQNPQMVRYILDIGGASLKQVTNSSNQTPLQLAQQIKNKEIINLLNPSPRNTGAIAFTLGILATPQLSYLAFLAISDQPSAAMDFLKSPAGIATSSVEIVALLLLVTALYKWSKEGEHKHLGKLAIGIGLAATADLTYLGYLALADKPSATFNFATSTNGVWTTSAEAVVLLVLALTIYAWHKNRKGGEEVVSQDAGEKASLIRHNPTPSED